MPSHVSRLGARRHNLAFLVAYGVLTAALVFSGAFNSLTAADKASKPPVLKPAAASSAAEERPTDAAQPAAASQPVTDPAAAAPAAGEVEPAEVMAVPVASCAPAPETPIPNMVVEIFRCRLIEAGYSPEQVRQVTAEAVTVAKCESKFDTNAVVFNGKWLNKANPKTGFRYSAAGVYQFIRKTSEKWIDGGYANVHDPVRNIDAAARLYVDNVRRGHAGWADWACAAVNDGFAAHSVLPGWPGGPAELPAWAYQLADS